MKTQLLKRYNLALLFVFVMIAGMITIVNVKAIEANITTDSIILANLILGVAYFLAVFGWVQDMRWDAQREKELREKGDS